MRTSIQTQTRHVSRIEYHASPITHHNCLIDTPPAFANVGFTGSEDSRPDD